MNARFGEGALKWMGNFQAAKVFFGAFQCVISSQETLKVWPKMVFSQKKHQSDSVWKINVSTEKVNCVILFQQFYVLNVFHGSQPLSEGELLSQLEKIINNCEPLEEPVGVLTSTDRTLWAKQRKRMLRGELTHRSSQVPGCQC